MMEIKHDDKKPVPTEILPGMREQGKGVKIYVESEFAPLKACAVGNAGSIYMPDPDAPELAHILEHFDQAGKEYMRKHRNTFLKDSDPELYEKMAKGSDNLAKAYRQAGVKVLRNEGPVPSELIHYSSGWSSLRFLSLYAQSAFETVGNCLVSLWDVTVNLPSEFEFREAINEIMQNDPNAVWLTMPVPYPTPGVYQPGPFLSPGDFRVFPDKTCIIGLGVAHPSHIKDTSKPRSSGTEFGVEILRRMLAPFGWNVEVIYFDSRYAYHIDCLMGIIDEGLIALPKDALWTPLPKQFQDWEVIEVDVDELALGACNNVPLGNKQVVMEAKAVKLGKEIEKRGYTHIPVSYSDAYLTFGSGIHCSTASIWRTYE